MVGIGNHALESGCAVHIVGTHDDVRQIFRITGPNEPSGAATDE